MDDIDTIKNELIQLNNHGCEHLVRGEFTSAVQHFTEGLRLVRHALKSNNVIEEEEEEEVKGATIDGSDDTNMVEAPSVCVAEERKRSHNMEVDFEVDDEEATVTETVLFFDTSSLDLNDGENLYSRPILIEYPGGSQCDEDEMPFYYSMNDFSFFLLFNLALTHHLDSICKVTSSTKGITQSRLHHHYMQQLESALSLYELAFTLQVHDETSINVLHACAVMNNIGHIQRRLNNEEKAKLCFQQLLSMLMVIVGQSIYDFTEVTTTASSSDTSTTICEAESIVTPFFHTIQPYILKRSSSAPAA